MSEYDVATKGKKSFQAIPNNVWLVVSTPLKNISQLRLVFPIYGKIKNVPNHQPDVHVRKQTWLAGKILM